MSAVRGIVLLLLALALAIVPTARGVGEDSKDALFTAKVLPILVGRCLGCHGAEHKGGLDLRSRASAAKGGEDGPVIVPGKPADSLLFQYVDSGEMPPKKPLTKEEVAVLERWIASGAYLPSEPIDPLVYTTDRRAGYDWWSLQPIRKPSVPTMCDASRVRTPIDAFVLARLEQAGLTMSPPADRATYVRRVTLDLIGLMPTYAEVQQFVADKRPDAYQRLVDRLLASPHYGERWGRHWLDVVRFAESNGFERDRIRVNFWPYRDYVIRAHKNDKPFNQFVIEQLAGDALPGNDPEHRIATGFLVAGPKNDVGTVSELERKITRQDELDEFVSATGTTFLGLSLGCARCHDHKFDPVPIADYYSLTAVFSGLDRGDRPTASPAELARHSAKKAALLDRLKEKNAAIESILGPVRERLLAERSKTAGDKLLPAVVFAHNEDRFAPVRAKFVRFRVTSTTSSAQPCLDELEVYGEAPDRNLALASTGAKATASSLLPGYPIHQVHHLNDGLYGNSHSWISNEPGAGWAQIELAEPAAVESVIWGRDREGRYRDRLATGYRIDVSLDGQHWTEASSSDRRAPFRGGGPNPTIPREEVVAALVADMHGQFDALQADRAKLEKELNSITPLPVSYVAVDGPPRPSFVLHRGDVRSPGEPVRPAALRAITRLEAILQPAQDSGPARRRRLAEWIVDLRNPLTSRVIVNRVWHYHFGQGIVSTPNDFGFNGDRPSHPELLDWLAADFMEHGWTMKRLHRLIVLSDAYRQSARFNAAADAKDKANRLLWRMAPRRLEAESLRDVILQTSGNLDLAIGGPSFRTFDYRDGNVPDYVLVEQPGPETWRRAVYMFNIRTFQTPLMSAFDCPDVSVQTPKRTQSVSALQALSLMNNQFILRQAGDFARRVEAAAGADPAAQAGEAYRQAVLRNPGHEERQRAAQFIRDHGLANFCRVLLNTNEFLYVF